MTGPRYRFSVERPGASASRTRPGPFGRPRRRRSGCTRDGSKRAVNALRAALNEGTFTEYHAVAFANMAKSEQVGGHTTAPLLEPANQVAGLRGESFDSAVTTMKYRDVVTASENAHKAAGGDNPRGPGTPTVVVNGRQVTENQSSSLFDQEWSDHRLTSAGGRPRTRWYAGGTVQGMRSPSPARFRRAHSP
ncbi:thioredoxin domain-containing protein [Streptomyces sp. NPDC046887]|uniref:DsbA family protein n=1 Tax=Streptomyces sp. NPDC046887 TaxID=3155472 RepID=UPI0033DB3BE7